MNLTLAVVRESDGRWLGMFPELDGVQAYGATAAEAAALAEVLALRVVAERIEQGGAVPISLQILAPVGA